MDQLVGFLIFTSVFSETSHSIITLTKCPLFLRCLFVWILGLWYSFWPRRTHQCWFLRACRRQRTCSNRYKTQRARNIETQSMNVAATSWLCINVEATLYKRHVSAGKCIQKAEYTRFECPYFSNFRHTVLNNSGGISTGGSIIWCSLIIEWNSWHCTNIQIIEWNAWLVTLYTHD